MGSAPNLLPAVSGKSAPGTASAAASVAAASVAAAAAAAAGVAAAGCQGNAAARQATPQGGGAEAEAPARVS